MVDYTLKDKRIVITNGTPEEIIWQGKPLGCAVEKILVLLEGKACIVLLDPYEFTRSDYRHLSNLIKVAPEGELIWSAQLPETNDSFVQFDCEEDLLFANSWSCFRVQIDIENGRTLHKVFTK